MKKLILFVGLALSISGISAFAGEGPGADAYGALSRIAPALRAQNLRVACRSFGEYLAHKTYANRSNTDVWTLRNLGFAADRIDDVMGDFCSGPNSRVSREDAIVAAESAFNTIGLESISRE